MIAGYPWFGDWGRDTFISIRGLGIATNQLEVTCDILLEWANHVSEGMLPNRFPDQDAAPEYNSVDALALVHHRGWRFCWMWSRAAAGSTEEAAEQKLKAAIDAILLGYQKGVYPVSD